jgi:transcriptional regulator with XRE-family HTH domain
VAGNLRRLRTASGLSLAALAAASGVAKGTISELERGRGNPTVETLFALAYALEATLADLVSDPPQDDAQVVRAVDRPFVPGSPLDARLLHRSQHSDRVLEVYELLVHPQAEQRAKAHRPGVREHVYLVHGDLQVGPVGTTLSLTAGDYAHYKADTDHVYRSQGGGRALLTLVVPVTA